MTLFQQLKDGLLTKDILLEDREEVKRLLIEGIIIIDEFKTVNGRFYAVLKFK